MFEKRKLDGIRVQIFEEIGRRCDAKYNWQRYPPIYGLGGSPEAASIVAVGETLLDCLTGAAPVRKGLQKAARKEIIRAMDVERGVEASVFLAHALVHWILIREECFRDLGRTTEPLSSVDIQSLAIFRKYFPVSELSEAVLMDEAANGFPTLKLTPETFTEPPPPPLESGYTIYLRDPAYADQSLEGEPESGEEPRDRLKHLQDTHIMVSAEHFRMSTSREAFRLAMGNAFDGSTIAENDPRSDKGLDWVLGHLALKSWWDAAETRYDEQITDMQEAKFASEGD